MKQAAIQCSSRHRLAGRQPMKQTQHYWNYRVSYKSVIKQALKYDGIKIPLIAFTDIN